MRPAPATNRLRVVGLLIVLGSSALPAAGCAGRHAPDMPSQTSTAGARGYRALFRGESQGPDGKNRFRLAVAILPPDRLRLEFFGPVGGPRVIFAASSDRSVTLLPGERTYGESSSSASTVDKLLGVPVDVAGLVALLTARPMCPQESMQEEIRTRPAATFGRTLSWVEVSCPPGEIRYEARSEERGGALLSATVSEGISGAIILEADYGDYEKGLGPRWPRQVRLRIPRKDSAVQLAAMEGPWASDLAESIFAPEIPEGFERRDLTLFPGDPGLWGAQAIQER
jgi:hypothetical protein